MRCPTKKRTVGLGRVAVEVVLQIALFAVRVKGESDASVEEGYVERARRTDWR